MVENCRCRIVIKSRHFVVAILKSPSDNPESPASWVDHFSPHLSLFYIHSAVALLTLEQRGFLYRENATLMLSNSVVVEDHGESLVLKKPMKHFLVWVIIH